MVKTCYKIKIDFRVFESCFVWFCGANGTLIQQKQPLLHSNTSTIGRQEWLFCMMTVALWQCKSGSLAA